MTDDGETFAIRLPPQRTLRLAVRRMTPARSTVTITGDLVKVDAGTWTARLPLADIASATIVDEPGRPTPGVHDHHGGHWTVTGLPGPVVRLTMRPGALSNLFPAMRSLDVGLLEPNAFLAAWHRRTIQA